MNSDERTFVRRPSALTSIFKKIEERRFSAVDFEVLVSNHIKLNSHPSCSEVHLKKRNKKRKDIDILERARLVDLDPRDLVVEEDFQYMNVIGTGGFGMVVKVQKKTTGEMYAMKIQPKAHMLRTTRDMETGKHSEYLLHMERSVLAEFCNLPFIVSLHYAFTTSKYSALVMDLVECGTLEAMVKDSPTNGLNTQVVAQFTVEIALALRHMHKKGIMYRDLKPANVLLCSTGHLKLCDFGLAGRINTLQERIMSSPVSVFRTPPTEPLANSPIPSIDPSITAAYMDSETSKILPISPTRAQENPVPEGTKMEDRDSNRTSGEAKEEAKEEEEGVSQEIKDGEDKNKGNENTIKINSREQTSSYSTVSRSDNGGEGDILVTLETPYSQLTGRGGPPMTGKDSITRKTTCGTAGYRAPEQVRERNIKYDQRGGYDETTDWFSLGTTCYVLLFGKKPFMSKTDIAKVVSRGDYDDLTKADDFSSNVIRGNSTNDLEIKALMLAVQYPLSVDPTTKDFLESLMKRDAKKRLNFKGVKHHPFVKDFPFDASSMANRTPHPYISEYIKKIIGESSTSQTSDPSMDGIPKSGKVVKLEESIFDNIDEIVEQFVSDVYEVKGSEAAERIEKKWFQECDNHSKDALFQRWSYISTSALAKEKEAALEAGILFRPNSPTEYGQSSSDPDTSH